MTSTDPLGPGTTDGPAVAPGGTTGGSAVAPGPGPGVPAVAAVRARVVPNAPRVRRRTAATTGVAALALAGSLVLSACTPSSGTADGSGGPDLDVSGAYVPEPVMDTMAGGFLTVHNKGGEADELTSVSADFAAKGEMHRTVDQKMEQVTSLPVPAGGALKLRRGGNHLMFLDLKRKPSEGDTVSLTLRFEKSGPVKVTVPVEATHHQPEK